MKLSNKTFPNFSNILLTTKRRVTSISFQHHTFPQHNQPTGPNTRPQYRKQDSFKNVMKRLASIKFLNHRSSEPSLEHDNQGQTL